MTKNNNFFVLVSGHLTCTTSGHSGRTIALGDLTHLSSGSKFHSFQFQPPTDLPCGVCVDEYCYEEGRCNPRCEDNMCMTDECVPIEVNCAEIIKNNVTLPFTVKNVLFSFFHFLFFFSSHLLKDGVCLFSK